MAQVVHAHIRQLGHRLDGAPEAAEVLHRLPFDVARKEPRGAHWHRHAALPDTPRFAVALVHGFGEHCGRYEAFASWLATRGAAVYACDLRGHGESFGPRGHADSLAELLDDAETLVHRAREAHDQLPLALVGHSMGGLLAAGLAVDREPDIDALVLSAAALSPAVGRLQRFGAALLRNLVPRMSLPAGLDTSTLSRDPEVVAAYEADPLVHGTMTPALACAFFNAADRIRASGGALKVPALVLHGSEDGLCSPAGSERFFERVTVPGSDLEIYEGLRHEIFNEPEREAVYQDVLDWLEPRLAGVHPPPAEPAPEAASEGANA